METANRDHRSMKPEQKQLMDLVSVMQAQIEELKWELYQLKSKIKDLEDSL